MKTKLLWILIASSFFACSKEDEEKEQVVQSGLKVYIGNEGNFGASNADVSYIDAAGVIHNDVYQSVNDLPLGDVLQSLTVDGNVAYAVMNNSNKIAVFNAQNFTAMQTIDGLTYPRHVFHLNQDKAYVSAGSGAGVVHVLNKTNYTLGASINVGDGPENMTVSNGNLYVCNSGGWANDNTVSVIDTQSDLLVATVAVSDQPVDAVTDANGDVWILCKGQTVYDNAWNIIGHTDARLYHIDSDLNEVVAFFNVGQNGDHPYSMTISNNGQDVYIANGDIYHMSIDGIALEIAIEGSFSTVDVLPQNDYLWLTGVNDFVNPGRVYAYTPAGALVRSYTAGIGTNGVVGN
jgi:YVTN family beta-propeller protein